MAQPIRFTPRSKAVLSFVSTEPSRLTLQNVLVTPEGVLVATDGHRLIVLEEKIPLDLNDFPECFTLQRDPLTHDVLLPADGVLDVLKAIPKPLKKHGLPVLLNAVQVANENGHITMGVTDLETPKTIDLLPAEGIFPNYSRLLPKDKPKARIGIGVEQLQALVEASKAIGTTGVELSIFTETGAMVWHADGPDAKATMIVMPMQLGESAGEMPLIPAPSMPAGVPTPLPMPGPESVTQSPVSFEPQAKPSPIEFGQKLRHTVGRLNIYRVYLVQDG